MEAARKTNESKTLKAGGEFSANLKLKEKAYIYLLMSTNNGNIEKLFPLEGMENMVNEGIDYKLPISPLTENVSNNKLHLIVSKHKISDLNSKLNDLKSSGIENIDKIFSGTSTQTINIEQKK